MIAPHIVSHVQPTVRDYSGTTAPRIITRVPTPEEARDWAQAREMARVTLVSSLTRYYRIGLGPSVRAHLVKVTEA